MCTSLTFRSSALYFGRNLDLEYRFGEKIVMTPQRFPCKFQNLETLSEHFAILGTAQIADGCPLYAEAVNEKGLCLAALHFPGNAVYAKTPAREKKGLAPFELFPFLLGTCQTAQEAAEKLQTVSILDAPFKPGYPVAPLHWHFADSRSDFVLECTGDGMHIYENPVGVLTNNPPFPFHLSHLQSFMHLTPNPPENHFAPALALSPYGLGLGAAGLPGDASPASRFVRAAFGKWNSETEPDETAAVTQVFHILESVSMVAGTVRTAEGKPDKTVYASCINASRGIYYCKTYNNSRISAVRLADTPYQSDKLVSFAMPAKQDICWLSGGSPGK